MEANNQPVILSAVRTPIGRFLGSLKNEKATDLGALVVQEAVKRAKIDPKEVAETIMGNVISSGLGQNPARQASIFGGLPGTVGAVTINKVCGSGLKSVMLAASGVKARDGEIFVAGGMENMSRGPFLVHGRVGQLRYGNAELVDSVQYDGLWDPFEKWIMGDAADFIADEYEVTREAMDEFSFKSHQKALAAIEEGKFKEEIVPVEIKGRKGKITVFDTDEAPRKDTSLEALANLKPAFSKNGKSTAGNAPGLNDGASAVVIASQAKADELGQKPLARIVGYTQQAVDPKYIFIAPARAIPALLEKVGWTMEDVDLIELNEAFSAQVLADGYDLIAKGHAFDWDKVNVNGGSIALGHPIGASGARVLTTLIYALKQRGLKRGIASLCLGGGEAVAMAIEIVD
ncbi:MAG: acetyl-CoA C-acetyltransferase [Chloroflexi bacterium]|nr:acetyl-CoA C-acetyltransferase [Chloroflexota bacterium]MBT3669757.1 acetyl-CoA C-acetyltransferase [Chloroflexota bacterium]MBT4305237.1 acetyl-CoA C-acetyltransferase [Chloroflexota bacterium]MBT4534840.1 acetyl-CoA C-acetyltransferase [Chloroflexota bacterium]MBT4683924.1 acetyl-CoA C-acetyltransferase [Chloroflexota bacterium]